MIRTNKKILISFFIFLVFSLITITSVDRNSLGKIGDTTITIEMEWSKTFGGIANDYGRSIIQTADGGFALAGFTRSYGAGGADFWLVKIDATGQTEWNQTYGGTADDIALSMIQTADGGFVLAGHTESYGAGGRDWWLVKTDTTGQAEWNQTYGGTGREIFRSVAQTTDGGFALAGGTWSYGAGDQDWWLVKTDATGQAEWNQTFGGAAGDRALSIARTADGGLALAGGTQSYGPGGADYWLIKTDATGQAEWNQTYGGTADDFANSMIQTADGGFALAGAAASYGAGSSDIWMVKTDATGQAEWNQTYGGTANDYALFLIQTVDGGFALVGSTESYGAGGSDWWLVKTDTDGQQEWAKTFGGIADDEAWSVIQTADGGFVLAGDTQSDSAGGTDIWLMKITASEDTTTTTESSPAWTLVIMILSLVALAFRKKMNH